ncbi:hypothetical protein C8035_v008077 [Colletotrichum spinosum]|uniref:Transmembrane protein n=1 Tax=Colletotrichum spinosum TaxID=1347390 RepID=A0A4V3HSP8_9PEZI|nr:hypothetical protein C8035_v008077 [Colletotrichum spinosum]
MGAILVWLVLCLAWFAPISAHLSKQSSITSHLTSSMRIGPPQPWPHQTSTIEVARDTTLVISNLLRTLTVNNPIVVTQTSIASPSGLVELEKRRPAPVGAGEAVPRPTSLATAQASVRLQGPKFVPSRFSAVRRQISTESVRAAVMVSTVTIEVTTTVTRTGNFVATTTIFNEVFTSVTAKPTVTTILLVTISPIRTSPQSISVVVPSIRTSAAGTTASSTLASTPVQTSSLATQLPPTSSTILGTTTDVTKWPVPSNALTTWFSASNYPTNWFTRPTMKPVDPQTSTAFDTLSTTPTPSQQNASSTAEPSSESMLGPGTIAGIAIGAAASILLVMLSVWLLRRRIKRRQQVSIDEDDYQMTPATAAAAMLYSPMPAAMSRNFQTRAHHADMRDSSSDDREIRVVIRPTQKRRTQSSGIIPVARVWPRPPGYNGQAFSFSAEESEGTTPRDPKTWSVTSEYGGSKELPVLHDGSSQGARSANNGQR